MEPAPISQATNDHFLKIIAEYISDIVAVYSLDWRYLQVSDSCKNILGYSKEELVGKPVYEFVHAEDLANLLDNSSELVSSYMPQSLTYRMKRKDGMFIWVETTIRRVDDSYYGKESKIIAVSKDITTRKSSEEMVKKFVEAVEYASDCIIMANIDGQVMYVNPAVKEVTGFDAEELVGKHANIVWTGASNPQVTSKMWDTLKRKKKTYFSEVENINKKGEAYFTEVKVSPILDSTKNVVFFVGISRDITKAKEVDRMKNEFISLASHQLRTPLTAIKWRLEILMDKPWHDFKKDQQDYLLDINRSNERMIDLVNSLLNISRIESGRLVIDPKLTSLEELMLTVIDDIEMKLKEKKIKLNLSFQTNIYDISVDQRLIRNAFLNIMSNAVKYTPENGTIGVSIYLEKEEIITKVTDTGYGIPKAEQGRVFQKFFRAENIRRIETEGTGLGLYLVKAIVEASGGRVWFESEENKGTTFWIALKIKGTAPKKGEVTLTR